MKISTIKQHLDLIITVIVLLLLCLGVYLWQNQKLNRTNQQLLTKAAQVSTLNTNNMQLKSQTSSLSKQLNTSNQDIAKLTQNGTFVAGSACQTQQLNLSEEKVLPSSAGTTGELFSYENTSTSSCTVNGYPGFLALASNGTVLPDGSIQTTAMFNDTGPTSITLSPNSKAYFAVSWGNDVTAPNLVCIKPSLIESVPPGNSYPLIITTTDISQICNEGLSISALASLSSFDF